MKILSILLIAIAVMINTCQTRRIRDLGFREHVQRTKEFRCQLPQPRAIPVRELFIVQPESDEKFYPTSTVLWRCDEHTGCCPEDQTCTPAEEKEIELQFIVTHMVNTNRPRHHEIIVAKNHTSCHCVNVTSNDIDD